MTSDFDMPLMFGTAAVQRFSGPERRGGGLAALWLPGGLVRACRQRALGGQRRGVHLSPPGLVWMQPGGSASRHQEVDTLPARYHRLPCFSIAASINDCHGGMK
eukprot:scaffold89286_cov49-Prasinocladus_malaysianus.AAC.1